MSIVAEALCNSHGRDGGFVRSGQRRGVCMVHHQLATNLTASVCTRSFAGADFVLTDQNAIRANRSEIPCIWRQRIILWQIIPITDSYTLTGKCVSRHCLPTLTLPRHVITELPRTVDQS